MSAIRYKWHKFLFVALLVLCIYYIFGYSKRNYYKVLPTSNQPAKIIEHNIQRQSFKNKNSPTDHIGSTFDNSFQMIHEFKKHEFRKAWDSILKGEAKFIDKSTMLNQMVIRMVDMGGEFECMQAITETIAEGTMREGLVANVFFSSSNVAAMREMYSALSEGDKKAATKGSSGLIHNYLTTIESGASFEVDEFAFLEKNMEACLAEACDRYYYSNEIKTVDEILIFFTICKCLTEF